MRQAALLSYLSSINMSDSHKKYPDICEGENQTYFFMECPGKTGIIFNRRKIMAGKGKTKSLPSAELGITACNMLCMMHHKILNECLLKGINEFIQTMDERGESRSMIVHLRDEVSRIMDEKTEYAQMKAGEVLLHRMRNYLETPSKNEKEEADKTALAGAIAHSARMGANLEIADEMQDYLDSVLTDCARFGMSEELLRKFRDDKQAFEEMTPEEIAGADLFSKSADEFMNRYEQMINQVQNICDLDSKYKNAMEQLDKAGIRGDEFMTIQKELREMKDGRDIMKNTVPGINAVLRPYQAINMNPRAMSMVRSDINTQTEAVRLKLNTEEECMNELSYSIAHFIRANKEKITDPQKEALLKMQNTLQEMRDHALDSLGKASEILKLQQGIDIAAEEASKNDRPFALYKIRAEERVLNGVDRTLTEFHFPHECFSSERGEPGIILHSQDAAKACLAVIKREELALCKRNIMHPASLTAYLSIANGYGKVYDGYTREQAEFIREKAMSRNIAMAVLEPESQNGKYGIAFESTKANNSLMLAFSAEALAITHGSGEKAGAIGILAENAIAREGAEALFNHIGNGEKDRYMVEIDPKNPERRLYISAKGMMEIDSGSKKWTPRSQDMPAQQYEASVYDRCSNFCRQPLVLPDRKALECGIAFDIQQNKETFKPNEKFTNQLNTVKNPIKDLDPDWRSMAVSEQSFVSVSTRFMMRSMKDNSLCTPQDVYKYIQDNFDLCAANYKDEAQNSPTMQKYAQYLEKNEDLLRADIGDISRGLSKDGMGFETHEYAQDARCRNLFDKTAQIMPIRKEWDRVQKAAEAALNRNTHEADAQVRENTQAQREEREQQEQGQDI